jgi:Fungal specific transcription factor domain
MTSYTVFQIIVVVAICSGRTLIAKNNGWLAVLCPMAEEDECIKHALLAFAAGYALELRPSEEVRQRANMHYRKASELLTEKLADPSNLEMGKEDVVVAALRIFWSDHVSPPCLLFVLFVDLT